MKNFRFRFEGLINKAFREEESVKKKLAPSVKRYNKIQKQIKNTKLNIEEDRNVRQKFFTNTSLFSLHQQNNQALRQTHKTLEKNLAKSEREMLMVQKEFQKAFVKRRSLEIIKQKDYDAYLKKKQKAEQFALEESYCFGKL